MKQIFAAAIAGGIFLAWGAEALDKLPLLKPEYFNIVLGAGLVVQLIVALNLFLIFDTLFG